jgi:peroxiredoxin
VLVFYRGGWCPYCNLHLRGFQRQLAEFQSAGAQIVAISPQLPDQSLTTQEKDELEFPVLSDVGLHAAHAFGVAFELSKDLLELYEDFDHPLEESNGTEGGRELPMPATFVILPDRTIAFAQVEADYTRRAEPLEVLNLVRELQTAVSHP